MSEYLRSMINDVLRETYTREVCQKNVDQIQERVELLHQAPSAEMAIVLEQGIELNRRAISHCREIYPGEFGLWTVAKFDSSKQES